MTHGAGIWVAKYPAKCWVSDALSDSFHPAQQAWLAHFMAGDALGKGVVTTMCIAS